MEIMKMKILRTSAIALALFIFVASPAPAQTGGTQSQTSSQAQQAGENPTVRNVTANQKAKMKGRIVRRDADTFNVQDPAGLETIVVLTDRTSVKSKGGFFSRGQNYDVTSLLRGLEVEIEGRGNEQGQLVADKVRFNSSDLKVARTVESRVSPVEKENQRISGQVSELNEVSRAARGEAQQALAGVAAANDRISALDDYSVQDSATVLFRVNSAVLSPEGKQALDELAAKAASTKGYVIEVAGFASSEGNLEKNRILSQRRADAVVRYLQENHDIPLRRMVTPYGYGAMKPIADNTTTEGRSQNRRVEVKLLVSRGLAQQSTQ